MSSIGKLCPIRDTYLDCSKNVYFSMRISGIAVYY